MATVEYQTVALRIERARWLLPLLRTLRLLERARVLTLLARLGVLELDAERLADWLVRHNALRATIQGKPGAR